MTAIEWRFTAFDALSVTELYALLQLRSEVFVVEQACVFQDMDGADETAMHLLGLLHGELVAYARCVPAGVKFVEASVGRVITRNSVRGTGAGHQLIDEALDCLMRQWGAQPVRIGAQARLEPFYQQHGFFSTGNLYVEDGIQHVEMLRRI